MNPDVLAEGLGADQAAWLQRIRHIDVATLPRAVRASVPDWLDERLAQLDDSEALLDALNRPANLDIRVNPLKAERDPMLTVLRAGPAGRFDPSPCLIRRGAFAWRGTHRSIAGPSSRTAASRCRTRAASCWPC